MTIIGNTSKRSTPIEVGLPAQTDSAADFDALLQLSRRADWRFLLPAPHLGNVACVGKTSDDHVAALGQFSSSLARFESVPHIQDTGLEFDVVVSAATRITSLEALKKCVRPDGWLYLEAFGRTGPAGLRQSKSAAQYVRKLERLGFTDVAAHWNWPDFESCTQLVPLAEPAALRHVIAAGGTGTRSRVRSFVGRTLLVCGLLGSFVSCFSVVARRLSS